MNDALGNPIHVQDTVLLTSYNRGSGLDIGIVYLIAHDQVYTRRTTMAQARKGYADRYITSFQDPSMVVAISGITDQQVINALNQIHKSLVEDNKYQDG